MSYNILSNYYAPKVSNGFNFKSHAISYNKCNFNCIYCDFRNRDIARYINYNGERYNRMITNLLMFGNSFKFTGGEPTLNPDLMRHIEIIKNNDGKVFLDSNGSNPKLIRMLLEKNLIDVLGISIKGLSEKEAYEVSGINNSKLCWSNVIETINLSEHFISTKFIITYVCHTSFDINSLKKFANLFKRLDNVTLKINNLMETNFQSNINLLPIDESYLEETVQTFVTSHPEWKGKIILINNKNAIRDFENINFY